MYELTDENELTEEQVKGHNEFCTGNKKLYSWELINRALAKKGMSIGKIADVVIAISKEAESGIVGMDYCQCGNLKSEELEVCSECK